MSILTYAHETGDYSSVAVLTSDGLDGVDDASRLEAEAFAALSAGDGAKAQDYADRLRKLIAGMTAPEYSPAYKRYATIALDELNGLSAIAAGKMQAGLAALKHAAQTETTLRWVPQPIAIPPAHELYAKELLKAGNYAEAASNYRIALQETPNRPMALLGLSKAAARMNDTATAAAMLAKFTQVWKTADPKVMSATVQN